MLVVIFQHVGKNFPHELLSQVTNLNHAKIPVEQGHIDPLNWERTERRYTVKIIN